jgi:protein-arginine kinase activator protein McsA
MPTPRKTTEKKLSCKYCGTEFWRTRNVQRFCSQNCQQQYWIVHVKGVRANVGRTFDAPEETP